MAFVAVSRRVTLCVSRLTRGFHELPRHVPPDVGTCLSSEEAPIVHRQSPSGSVIDEKFKELTSVSRAFATNGNQHMEGIVLPVLIVACRDLWTFVE